MATEKHSRVPSVLRGIYTKVKHRKQEQPPSDAELILTMQAGEERGRLRERLAGLPQRRNRRSPNASAATRPSWSTEGATHQGAAAAARLGRTPGIQRLGPAWAGGAGGGGSEGRPPPAPYTSGPGVFFEQDAARTTRFENPRAAPVPAPFGWERVAKPREWPSGPYEAREVNAAASPARSRGGTSDTMARPADRRADARATPPPAGAGRGPDESPARGGGGKAFRRGKDPPFPSRPRGLPAPPSQTLLPSPSATATGEARRTTGPPPSKRRSALLMTPVQSNDGSLTTASARLDGPSSADTTFPGPPRTPCRLCRKPGAGGAGGLCAACEAEFVVPSDALGEPDGRGGGRAVEAWWREVADPRRDDEDGAAPEAAEEPRDVSETETGAGSSSSGFEGPLSPLWAEPTQRAARRVQVREVDRDEVLVSTLSGASRRRGARGARRPGDGDAGRRSPGTPRPAEDQRPFGRPVVSAARSAPGDESDSSATVVVPRSRGRQGDEEGSAGGGRLSGGARMRRVDSHFDEAGSEDSEETLRASRKKSWSSSVYSAKTSQHYDEILDLIDSYRIPDEGPEVPPSRGHGVKAAKAPPRPEPAVRPSQGVRMFSHWI